MPTDDYYDDSIHGQPNIYPDDPYSARTSMCQPPDPFVISNHEWAGPENPFNPFHYADVGYPLCSDVERGPTRAADAITVFDSENSARWIEMVSPLAGPRERFE